MNLSIGTLVEMDLGQQGTSQLFVKKVDEIQRIVILEHKSTGKKIQLTFEEFSKVSGLTMDNRILLKG